MKRRIAAHLLNLCTLLYLLSVSSVHGSEVSNVRTGEDLNDDGEDLTVELENEDGDAPLQNVFEPTSEWKTVEEGQVIPPGLHVRMNLQTGLKEAKILDENEEPDVSYSDNKDESQFEKSAGRKAHEEFDLQELHESID